MYKYGNPPVFDPFTCMPSGHFYLQLSDLSISEYKGRLVSLFIVTIFLEDSIFHANSGDNDQTLRFTAFDLGLHCLPNTPFIERQA